MQETTITLKVSHAKPLPPKAAEVIGQRFYAWAYSQGCEVGVTAEIEGDISRYLHDGPGGLLAHSDLRCVGHGAGPSGHQNRVDCQNCLRRTMPRAGYPLMLEADAPKQFPCPIRIPEAV